MNATRHEVLRSVGLLILRVGIGGYLATHGWGKVQMVLNGDFDKFGADPIGLGPGPSLVLAAGAEFVCSLLVVVGLGTRLAALPPAFAMGVAAFVVHANDPWTAGEGYRLYMEKLAQSWSSKEPALLFMFAFLALAFTGPGRFSIDGLIGAARAHRAAEAAAAAARGTH